MTSARISRSVALTAIIAVLCACLADRLLAVEAAPGTSREPQSIADLAPPEIPDEQNAAAHLESLGPLLQAWNVEYAQFSNSALGMEFDQRDSRGERPTDEQAAAIRKLLDTHAELDTALQRAAACEQYASRLDYSHLDLASPVAIANAFRPLGYYYALRINLLTLADQRDEAVRRGVEALRLARLHQREPTLVAALVNIAVQHLVINATYDALASGRVSFATHAALEGELSQFDSAAHIRHVLQTERVYALAREQAGLPLLPIGQLTDAEKGCSGYVAALVEASERPWDVFAREASEGGKFDVPTGFGADADNLAPGIVATVKAFGRNMAMTRALRAYNALRLFEKLQNRQATGLADVDLPEEAVADPFSGELLRAKSTDAGWVVYSVMANGVDDGGDFRDQRDYGVAPPKVRLAP
jgi:hypothetical protein